MNPVLADIIGLVGSAGVVGAYVYNNVAARVDPLLYNFVNFIGALLLCISLTVHFNLASLILEFVWMTIAVFGIGKAIRMRGRA